MHLWRVSPILLLSFVTAIPASAELVTVHFEGFVVNGGELGDADEEQFERLSGFFEYDAASIPIVTGPGRADYLLPAPKDSNPFQMRVGDTIFRVDDPLRRVIGVGNDHDYNFPDDPASLGRQDVFGYSLIGERTQLIISLSDTTRQALMSTELPRSFDISMWDVARITLLSPYESTRRSDGTIVLPGSELLISGRIDSITVVPEPYTLVTAAVALACATFIAAARRLLFRKGGKHQR